MPGEMGSRSPRDRELLCALPLALRATGFSLVLVLSTMLLVLGVSAAWYVQHLYKGLSDVLDLNVASVRAAEELEIALRDIHSRLYRVVYDRSAVDLEAIERLQGETDRWLGEAERLATTPREQELMQRVSRGYEHFKFELHRSLANPDQLEAQVEMRDLIDNILTKEIIVPTHEYLDYNEETMVSFAKKHRISSSRFSWVLLVTCVSGCFGGFALGMHASRRHRKQMVELNLPLSFAAGKLSEVLGPVRLATTLDLGELKRILEVMAEEVARLVTRLQKSHEKALQTEKLAAIGQLAAGTAHEIRNPLMSIKLLIQAALVNPQKSALSSDDLQLIEQEICRLERTVQSLLDYARPQCLARRPLSIKSLLKNCLALVEKQATLKGISVSEQLPSDLPLVEGDAQQLQQVLLNLLLNAVEAVPEGGQIRVEVDQANDSDQLEVRTLDNGHGIPENLLPQIFEPFTSTKRSGTGLGLSISKQIIEAHAGRIFAENLPGGGAMVAFTLPKAQNPPQETP